MTNELLRDHVTGTAFNLNLGKTHVAALVRIDLELTYGRKLDHGQVRRIARAHQLDVTATSGLVARGLVVNVWPDHEDQYMERDPATGLRTVKDFARWMASPPSHHWRITRAGRLVCELLAEAGLYAEWAGPLLPLLREARGA